jgi:hypothetical protein
MITAIVTFIGTYSVLKYEVKQIKRVNGKQSLEIEKLKASHLENKDSFFKTRERDQRAINEKFEHTDFKREQLKDVLTTQIHAMDKKITEIHTIIVTKNKA